MAFISGQPDNWRGNEDCGSLVNGGWNDLSCDWTEISICKKLGIDSEGLFTPSLDLHLHQVLH